MSQIADTHFAGAWFAETQMAPSSGNSLAVQIKRVLFLIVAFISGLFFATQVFGEDVQVLNTFDSCNVAIGDGVAYVAAGNNGIVLVDLSASAIAGTVSPPPTTGTVDDIAVDGELLFTLDGFSPGRLTVFSIADPLQPAVVSGPTTVDVGPFAGVSAANGRVVVSGGTGLLNAFSYNQNGILSSTRATIDLGIGQPDVLVSDDGSLAFVSTDFAGNVDGEPFGLTVVNLANVPASVSILDRVGIDGAGFSAGFATPANFPVEAALDGDTLYMAYGSGVTAFDVSNPGNVQTIAEIPLSTNSVNIDVFEDQLYIVGNSPTATLTTIDVANLNSPAVTTANLPAGQPLGVAVTNGAVVIADGSLGVVLCTSTVPEVEIVGFNVFRGSAQSGNLSSLTESDDVYLETNPGFTLNASEAPVWLEFDGVSTTDTPSSLSFEIESNANTPSIELTTELFNFDTGAYEVVGVESESFNTDSVSMVDASGSVDRFVEPSTGTVRSRVGWRVNGFVIVFPWTISVDHVGWTVQ